MIVIKAQLVGVVPKKGSGTLDGGQTWSHDHVELHLLTPLSSNGAKGFASMSYRIQDCDSNLPVALSAVGKEINLNCELGTNGKNDKPSIVPISFKVA